MADDFTPVSVSRRIGASAGEIFAILADPVRHLDFDGSEMLRGAVTTARMISSPPISGRSVRKRSRCLDSICWRADILVTQIQLGRSRSR